MTKKLSGKVALVTGGSRGIGAASARALADEGADIAISYVASSAKAEAVVEELKSKGVRARAFKADQASESEVERLVRDVAKEFGRLDILVNNAGVATSAAVDDPNSDSAALARQDAINVHGVITAIRTASKLMGEGGRIVTISSVSGITGNRGQVNYSAAKAGIIGATKALAVELATRSITVNCVAPGVIETAMIEGAPVEEILKMIPMQRLGRPEEISGLVAFLLSDEASYLTRQVISVNGGMC